MNTLRAGLRLFNAKLLITVIQTAGVIYFAREVGATQIGIFFLFQALLGILSIPADFGLRSGVVKRISEGTAQGGYLSSVILAKLLSLSVFALLVVLFRSYINEYVGAEVAVYFAVALILYEAAKLSAAVLKGELRVGETAEIQVAKELIWLVSSAALVFYGLEARALIFGLLIGLTVMSVWGWYKISISFGQPSVSHARSLFDYSKFSVMSTIGGFFYSWMDVAIIGLFLTQAHVGAYEVAWRVTVVSTLLSSAIATALFPQVSQWDAADQQEKIQSLIRDTLAPSMVIAVPAFFGVTIFSREILSLTFGEEFTMAWIALIILSSEKVIQSIHIILGRALQGINRPDLAAKATVFSIVLNLVLNIVLVLQFGITGAAVATAISFAINGALHAYYVSQFVSIEIPVQEMLAIVLSSAAMAGLLFFGRSVVAIETFPVLIGAVTIGAVLYFLFMLLLPSSRAMIRDNYNQFVSGR